MTTCASRSESPVISSGGSSEMNFHAAFVGQRLDQFHAIGNRLGKIKRSRFIGFLPGVKPRQFQQRFDQFPHPLRRALAGFDGLAVFAARCARGSSAVCVCVSITETGVRSSCAASEVNCCLLRERGFEPGEGGIQNGGELAEFAFRLGDVDALRQIAGGNFHGGRR